MAEDDFQKGNPNDKPNLGLRDAISNARQNYKNLAEERALELFKEMKIIDKATTAIEKGKSEVTVEFPSSVKEKFTDSRFKGEVTWSDVIASLVFLIKEEVENVSVNKKQVGGCCSKPRRYLPQPGSLGTHKFCKRCQKRFKEKTGESFTSIHITF